MKETATPDLVVRLEAARPTLTGAGQRLVALILEDVGAASQMTIAELSDRVGTSQASVVRTSRALGFRGYPELRLALAAAASSAPAAGRTVVGDIAEHDDIDAVLRKLALQETTAIEQTAAGLDREALNAAIAAVAVARVTEVYGVAASSLVGLDLAQKLQRIGRIGRSHPDRHLAVTSAALLGPSDVAIGISHSGETRDVIEPLRHAGRVGAVTVAVTSHPRSTLAKVADHVLACAGSEERAFRPGATASRISQLLVVDAIFVGVAQHDFVQTSVALETTRKAVAELDRSTRPR